MQKLRKGFDKMKATGIVRRIDDLGRIVIPKEIRRTLRIREGDPLEIYLEDGGVVFKKYSPLGMNKDVIHIAHTMASNAGFTIAIYDRDSVMVGPRSFPHNVGDYWEYHRDVFQDGDFFIYPVYSDGELVGFIASDKQGVEIEMIQRYLSAALNC